MMSKTLKREGDKESLLIRFPQFKKKNRIILEWQMKIGMFIEVFKKMVIQRMKKMISKLLLNLKNK
jgi:hypothetical protein